MARRIGGRHLLTLLIAVAMASIGALGLTGYVIFGPELLFWFQVGLLFVAIGFSFLLGMQYAELMKQENGEIRRA